MLNSGLAKLLGFSREIVEPGKEYTADKPHRLAVYREIGVHLAEVSSSDKPHRLAVYREIGVHLAEVSSSDNLHNGNPSTLLRSVAVENEKCGSGRTEIPCLGV